jgi:hypothetical protein
VLGRFLEWSIPTPDIRASMDFYARLGFSETEVGEAWSHPYAVMTDGRLCLGLHQQADFPSSLTFVKPDLLAHLGQLDALGLEFEIRRLGNDVFNEVGWHDHRWSPHSTGRGAHLLAEQAKAARLWGVCDTSQG